MAQHTYANGNNAMHQPDDVIAMLTADRRQVRALFKQYEDTPDPYPKQIIAEHVLAERTLYMLLEEMVFYAAFAEQDDEAGKQLVGDTLQEGFILPLFVACIGRNGSMMCGPYDDMEATGLDFILEASHI